MTPFALSNLQSHRGRDGRLQADHRTWRGNPSFLHRLCHRSRSYLHLHQEAKRHGRLHSDRRGLGTQVSENDNYSMYQVQSAGTRALARTHSLSLTHTHTNTHTDLHTHARTHTHTLAYTHKQTNTHTHTCTRMQTHSVLLNLLRVWDQHSIKSVTYFSLKTTVYQPTAACFHHLLGSTLQSVTYFRLKTNCTKPTAACFHVLGSTLQSVTYFSLKTTVHQPTAPCFHHVLQVPQHLRRTAGDQGKLGRCSPLPHVLTGQRVGEPRQ